MSRAGKEMLRIVNCGLGRAELIGGVFGPAEWVGGRRFEINVIDSYDNGSAAPMRGKSATCRYAPPLI